MSSGIFGLAELEAALVLGQHDFVDEALRGALDRVGAGVHLVGGAVRFIGARAGLLGALIGRRAF